MLRSIRVTHAFWLSVWVCALLAWWSPIASAQDGSDGGLAKLENALVSIEDGASAARQRLAMRRVIRDAEELLEKSKEQPERWEILEFLFRAQRQLVGLDKDAKYREALIETCRELVKAPNEFAGLRLEADLLLSQVEQAKKGGEVSERSEALRKFVVRYIGTAAGAKALRATMLMALEMGDTRLVNDLRKIIAEHYSSDLEMITFLRDHLGGQVFGVPFVGHFKRSDGKTVYFPMDGLGHSSMVIFWSKDDVRALQYIADLAAAEKIDQDRVDGRLELISINLDQLPDAGASIIRRLGADWQCLHFPGGRDNPMYDAYVRVDPLNMRVAPTGQTAMMMRESRKKPEPLSPEALEETLKSIKPSGDHERQTESFRRTLIRSWSLNEYAMHLSSLMTGDFLIFDPETFDPTMPPELKGAAKGEKVTPLRRSANCVPAETLQAIQDCMIAPPQRYRASVADIRTSYQKMQKLSRQAMADHPTAPDLWIVRNRLITSLIGLWKTDFDLAHFEAAVTESKKAIEAGYPKGTDVVARFCLARQSLRSPNAKAGKIIEAFVSGQGGAHASGPVLAAASLLALDVADEARYQHYRDLILKSHTEYPMMWAYSSFLLSRYHDYWMFQVPFTAGWSFGRRLKYEMNKGEAEDARRILKVELPTADGGAFRIPEDLTHEFTVICFVQPSPWRGNAREDTRPPSPSRVLRRVPSYVASRPDVDLMIGLMSQGDIDEIRKDIRVRGSEKQLESPILTVPGGMGHPLVQRLGMESDDGTLVILNKQGQILTVLTGLTIGNAESVVSNTVERQDEIKVMQALEQGNVEEAKKRIMGLAPPYDPNAVDDRGRKLKEPKYGMPHLRARARVYMALKEWDKALEDVEVVVQRQLGQAGGMSLRTEELDESEALRATIRERIQQADR